MEMFRTNRRLKAKLVKAVAILFICFCVSFLLSSILVTGPLDGLLAGLFYNSDSFSFGSGGILSDVAVINERISRGDKDRSNAKRILIFNDFFGTHMGQEMMGGCPDYNCNLTTDLKMFAQSDAVIFHAYTFSASSRDQGLPAKRQPWQRFIFFVQESPVHTSISEAASQNFYNWTFTYRRDSDLPSPYGYTVKLTNPKKLDFDPIKLANRKSRLIAWFVSNCAASSMRQDYVQALMLHVPVDIFGACGNFSCPRHTPSACYDHIEREYKFYLSFENSVCKDYVTEKFWGIARLKVVPIVLKRSIVEPYAPPNSFIAVDDFASPREMADYLKRLDADDNLYAQYFQWRTDFKIIYLNGVLHDINERPWGMCLICKKLWEEANVRSTYYNLKAWWQDEAECSNDFMLAQLRQSQPQSTLTVSS